MLLLLTVPLQLMVEWKVVTGLPPEGAHAHAHAHGHEAGERDHEHEHEEGHDEEAFRGNLIPNYGFEVGTREQAWGWQPRVRGSSVVYRDTKVKRRGSASGAVAGEALSSGPSGWVFRSDVLPRGKGLTLRGHLLSEAEWGGAYLLLRAFRRDGEGRSLPLVEVSRVRTGSVSQWQEIVAQASVPHEAEGLEVEVGFYGKGKAWFDDMCLEVSVAPELPAEENLLSNPSFERGLEDWLPFGERGEGDSLQVRGQRGDVILALSSDGGEPWGISQGLVGFPEKGTLRVEGRLGSTLEEGHAYLDLFLFRPDGPQWVRVAELVGAGPVRDFQAELSWEGDLTGAWLGVVVDGKGILWVEETGLRIEPSP